MLYTSQYRYSGQDRIDITAKGTSEASKMFSPTWTMVMGYKKGLITERQYTKQYYELLINRWHSFNAFKEEMNKIVIQARSSSVTVVCFCPAGNFCHRHLFAKFINYNYGVKLGGEIEVIS
jgi:hypothetical protein